jgi:hypothetical protein
MAQTGITVNYGITGISRTHIGYNCTAVEKRRCLNTVKAEDLLYCKTVRGETIPPARSILLKSPLFLQHGSSECNTYTGASHENTHIGNLCVRVRNTVRPAVDLRQEIADRAR